MRKLKKLAVWALVLAMIISMVPAMTLTASAASISEDYPEATELMAALGVMDNSTKAWTDPLGWEEANDILFKALVNNYGWTLATWGVTEYTDTDAVTCGNFVAKAAQTLGWGTASVWIDYFHLTRDVKGFSSDAAITREQAAQILNNTLKGNPNVEVWGNNNPTCILGTTIHGLAYERTTDGLGRPTYQWKKNGTAMASAYKAKPLAVLPGGTDWVQLMDATGRTAEQWNAVNTAWGWNLAQITYSTTIDGGAQSAYNLGLCGAPWGAWGSTGSTIEIYDSYKINAVVSEGNEFRCRGYDFVMFTNWLAEIEDTAGTNTLKMYCFNAGTGFYGPWTAEQAGCAAIATSEPGFYIMNHNGAVANLRKATVVKAILDAVSISDNTITYTGGITKKLAGGLTLGKDLLTGANMGKGFIFYLDDDGKVIGAELCEHENAAKAYVDATSHSVTCPDCGVSTNEAHTTEIRDAKDPTYTETGYTGDTWCSVCETKLETGTEIPVETCVHDWELVDSKAATDLEDGWEKYECKNESSHTKTETIPANLTGVTDYPEATQLMGAIDLMNKDNKVWKQKLTGEEADKIMDVLYSVFGAPVYEDLSSYETVTVQKFLDVAMPSTQWSGDLYIEYFNIEDGMNSSYNRSKDITREEAAQLLQYILRINPGYNTAWTKAQDPNIGVIYVKTSSDADGRPTYQWQTTGGTALTTPVAAKPVATVKGGTAWKDILDSVGLTAQLSVDIANTGAWSQRQFNYVIIENGVQQGDYYYQWQPNGEKLKSNTWTIEIYDSYKMPGVVDTGATDPSLAGVVWNSRGYELVVTGKDTSISDIDTQYPEAVELMINLGWMDASDLDFKKDITPAEANAMLRALYDGPGFVDPWSHDYKDTATVRGKTFISKCLITVGWNYNADELFGRYNNIEKGLQADYGRSKALSREEAAQLVLNTLKIIPTYQGAPYDDFKYQDGRIGLTLVQTGVDELNRPSYKWQKDGKDLTASYQDSPVYCLQGGIDWTTILIVSGDPGEVNRLGMYRWCEEGGEFTDWVGKKHPSVRTFKSEEWALEIYRNYSIVDSSDGIYCFDIITYLGTAPTNPRTGDTVNPMVLALVGFTAVAAAFVLLMVEKNKRRAK